MATYTATFSTAGSHSLTAVYAGDTDDATSTSSAIAEAVSKKSTTTALTSGVNPVGIGASTTLTATVTPTSATGTATFKDGTTTLGTGTLTSGVATYTATFSTAGSHSLTAVYAGDTNNATSTSSAVAETASKKSTTTALTSGVNPVAIGASTTLTATVTPTTATGTVTFKDGTTTLGTGTLTSGVATYMATFSTAGSHSLTAVYSGDTNNATSTSSAVAETVSKKSTTTALISGVNPVAIGASTTLTATVTPTTATGTVTFKDGTTTLGTGTLTSGVATYMATFSTAGSHSLTAVYSGDTNNATSTSSAVAETVSKKSTTTALISGVNPVAIGASTTLTATVTPTTATGTVTFKDGTTTLGTGTLTSGVATYMPTFSTAGSHSLTAVYAGDANNATSTSSAIAETVTSSITTSTLSLTPSANPVAAGNNLTLLASVAGSSPTGNVQFMDGSANMGSPVSVVSSQASYSLTASSVAGHVYTAKYSGDTSNSTSSAQIAVNVTGATSITTLGTSATAATPTTSVALTATITGSSPTGSVVFRDGATVLHTATVASGTATWSQTLANGQHLITASYSGDATNASSMSTATVIQISASGSDQPSTALHWSYQYDVLGNLTQVVDANAAATQGAYDSLSRDTTITQPVPATGQDAPVITFGYDLQDRPASVTDQRGLTTRYTTDGLGNTTALTSPDTGASTLTYYDNGLLHTAVDARARTSTYTYDALDRLSTVAYSDGGTGIVLGYDAGTYGKGHLTSATDESGSTTFLYDGLGRVKTKTQVSGPSGAQRTFVLTYNWGTTGSATGKLVSVVYPSGATVRYGYDTAGRVNDVGVTGADGVVTKILTGLSYNALSQPRSWVWGVGAVPYQRSFDGYGRLASYPLGNPSGTGIAAGVKRTLIFDAAGRIVGYTHTTPANWDQSFSYDGLERVTSATLVGGNTFSYAYDLTGNRTQTVINATAYADTVAANSNWYANVTSAAGGATAQGYDASGHLTSDANGAYTYSGRGRLKTALRSGNTFNYLYNAFEQRVYKAGPSSVITTGVANFVYDEAGHLVGEYDSTGRALYETVYLGDLPVAALIQPAMGQTNVFYIYADHLNTARVIVRPADQAIVWSWGSNEPFGQSQANSNPNSLGNFTYNPRFPGQVSDVESGWFYNWNRDYNPALGRYVQSDPVGLAGRSTSTYSYVTASPLMLIDPDGLMGQGTGRGTRVPGTTNIVRIEAGHVKGQPEHAHIYDKKGNLITAISKDGSGSHGMCPGDLPKNKYLLKYLLERGFLLSSAADLLLLDDFVKGFGQLESSNPYLNPGADLPADGIY